MGSLAIKKDTKRNKNILQQTRHTVYGITTYIVLVVPAAGNNPIPKAHPNMIVVYKSKRLRAWA